MAKADTKLFNRASQVALVRDGDRTVITMANDFEGNLKEFAVVVPVPTFLHKEQIHIGDKALMDHLDAYSSPRLVEYFDPDPCQMYKARREAAAVNAQAPVADRDSGRAKSLGVTIEAKYTIGEYDILILSAQQSSGLETWLRENGYRIPDGAGPILGTYLKQGVRFFVAKVNLKEQARLGFSYLRPIQVAFESPKFMLPIRLGTVNANGPQELFIYALTRKGRVETTNYRTVKLPSDLDIPLFVKDEFGGFYRAVFSEQVKKERMKSVFLEYAWDMNWCDPCAAQPLSREELRSLGVFWLASAPNGAGGTQEVFLTRLHVRYDADHFPEDLVFQETADRANFQARYVLRHAYQGQITCASEEYRDQLAARHDQEAKNLAELTGWRMADIRRKMELVSENIDDKKWYERIWAK